MSQNKGVENSFFKCAARFDDGGVSVANGVLASSRDSFTRGASSSPTTCASSSSSVAFSFSSTPEIECFDVPEDIWERRLSPSAAASSAFGSTSLRSSSSASSPPPRPPIRANRIPLAAFDLLVANA